MDVLGVPIEGDATAEFEGFIGGDKIDASDS